MPASWGNTRGLTMHWYCLNKMKRQTLFSILIVWFILGAAKPLYAQKNLLPAAKAAVSKSAIQAAAERAAFQSSANSAASVSASVAKANFQHWTAAQIPAVKNPTSLSVDKVWFPEEKKNLLEKLKERLKKRFYVKLDFVSSWRQHKKEWESEKMDANTLPDFEATLQQIAALKESVSRWNPLWQYSEILWPIQNYSPFAAKNNQMLAIYIKNLIKKLEWLEAYPNQAKDVFVKDASHNAVHQLAHLLRHEKLIMLGEFHYRVEVQQTVAELVSQLKKQNPNRRVVLFTEFLDLPLAGRQAVNSTIETYYRRTEDSSFEPLSLERSKKKMYAAKAFQKLLHANVEVYPLEDRTYLQLVKASGGIVPSMRGSDYRNKSWARIITKKMAEIRQTDPDALFVVYAGNGHTSWLSYSSLPKFFAPEKPVVVQILPEMAFSVNPLYSIWGADAPLFEKPKKDALFYWTGKDAALLARNSGFNYVLVPAETWYGKLHRKYVSFVLSE